MTQHNPRYVPTPDALIEITVRTTQSRFLLRPSRRLNRLVVGILAHALRSHRVKLHAAVFLSNHFHLLISPASVEEMSSFMRLVNRALSGEIGKLHDWSGSMWARRYTSIPVSDEPEAQIARLRYLLSHGAKEGLVRRPSDWPGVHCADALADGTPMEGVWIDRTAFHEARKRGHDVVPEDFEETLELHLDPLPCWAHLDDLALRQNAADLLREIEDETKERHRKEGTAPFGARAVLRTHPHDRPSKTTRSPKPAFHALRRRIRAKMKSAHAAFVRDYSEAARRLREGHSRPVFPPNCFPPALPFVPPRRSAEGLT